MSKYAIMRIAKIKSRGGIGAIDNHNRRKVEVPNADRKGMVERVLPYNPESILTEWKHMLGDHKPRKNAVLAYEIVMSASPEWWNKDNVVQRNQFTQNSIKWLKSTFGDRNILSIDMHRDEKTPHLHAVIIPMKDGKLNAYHFTGGREKMRNLQDTYAENMKPLDLQRGIRDSKAKHQTLKRHYAQINTIDEAEQREIERRVVEYENTRTGKLNRKDVAWLLNACDQLTRKLQEKQKRMREEREKWQQEIDAEQRKSQQHKNDYLIESRKYENSLNENRKLQKQIRELKEEIKNKKDYTISLLHDALQRNGYDSNAELNKQHDMRQREQARNRGMSM